jgi:phage internal scaffolding protein
MPIVKKNTKAHRVQVTCPTSRVRPEFQKDSEAGNIINRFQKTGQLPAPSKLPPEYGFANSMSYHEIWNQVLAAQNAFQELPSKVRSRFNQDPGAIIDFCNDASNFDEAVELGLIERPQEVQQPPETPSEPAQEAIE